MLTRTFDAPQRLFYIERFVGQSFASAAARDLVLSRPMERGLGEGYRRLDRVLAAVRI